MLAIISVAGLACFSVAASAAPPPGPVAAGCNQDVWNALAAKAEAQVAYDVAVTRQMINKPDSVLTLTCFDQSASISATAGGKIFSGDFSTPLSNIMPVNAPPGGKPSCTGINDLWNTISTSGINTGAPYASFDDLATGTLPAGGGADFNTAWKAAATAGVFTNLNGMIALLPKPPTPPLDFTAAKSSCDVLVTAQIIPGPCPTPPTVPAGG